MINYSPPPHSSSSPWAPRAASARQTCASAPPRPCATRRKRPCCSSACSYRTTFIYVRTDKSWKPVDEEGCIPPGQEHRELLVEMSCSCALVLPSLPGLSRGLSCRSESSK